MVSNIYVSMGTVPPAPEEEVFPYGGGCQLTACAPVTLMYRPVPALDSTEPSNCGMDEEPRIMGPPARDGGEQRLQARKHHFADDSRKDTLMRDS